MVFFYPTSRSYIFFIPPPFHKSNPNDNQKMSTTKYKLKYSINTISSHYTLYRKHITWYNWNWLTERKSSNRPGFGVPSTQLLFIFFLLSHFLKKSFILEGVLRGLNPSPWSFVGSLLAHQSPFYTTIYLPTNQAAKYMSQIHKGSNNCHNISPGHLKCTKINIVTIISMVTFNYS